MKRNPYARSLRIHHQRVREDGRADALLKAMRDEHEQEVQRLAAEDPDWVKELLDRLK